MDESSNARIDGIDLTSLLEDLEIDDGGDCASGGSIDHSVVATMSPITISSVVGSEGGDTPTRNGSQRRRSFPVESDDRERPRTPKKHDDNLHHRHHATPQLDDRQYRRATRHAAPESPTIGTGASCIFSSGSLNSATAGAGGGSPQSTLSLRSSQSDSASSAMMTHSGSDGSNYLLAQNEGDSFGSTRSDGRGGGSDWIYSAPVHGSPSLLGAAPASPFRWSAVPAAASGATKYKNASAAAGATAAHAAAATAAGGFPVQEMVPGVVFSSPQHMPHAEAGTALDVHHGASPDPTTAMLPSHFAAAASAAAGVSGMARHVRSNTGSPKTISMYVIKGGQTVPYRIGQQGKNGSETMRGIKGAGEGPPDQTLRGLVKDVRGGVVKGNIGGPTWSGKQAVEGGKSQVKVKAGANPAAVEAYLKLKAQQAGRK
ncbi:hypothetical protein CLOM_g24503 [Closterium sp. NIES-68]|nr:hypothetical protein CLOM_g24503 [Closterium sp. NIES-68]GJP75502.1 hypothetical protein CLOP_g5941 [Closterium sp. NIES-67]